MLYLIRLLLVSSKHNGAKTLAAENMLLRQQLVVVRRKYKRAPNLTIYDRMIFSLCGAMIKPTRLVKTAIIIKPSTILAFHKALIKRKYSALYAAKTRRKPGPKGPSAELIKLIVEMKQRNPRFGCPRIAMQIQHAFGIEINKDIVRRVLDKHYKPKPKDNSPSWLSFLGNIKDSLWSIDFFKVESVHLKTYWVMVVMDQFTRRIVGFAVHNDNLNGIAACCMFNSIIKQLSLPKCLSSDNDPIFRFHRWKANLRILEIKEIKSIPFTPTSHPFIERLIGTVRRELLDRVLVFNSIDLQRKLDNYIHYYNESRAHSALDSNTPETKTHLLKNNALNLHSYQWESFCNKLFMLPCPA